MYRKWRQFPQCQIGHFLAVFSSPDSSPCGSRDQHAIKQNQNTYDTRCKKTNPRHGSMREQCIRINGAVEHMKGIVKLPTILPLNLEMHYWGLYLFFFFFFFGVVVATCGAGVFTRRYRERNTWRKCFTHWLLSNAVWGSSWRRSFHLVAGGAFIFGCML